MRLPSLDKRRSSSPAAMTGPGLHVTVQARGQYMDQTSAKLMLGEGARDADALLSIYPVPAISKDLCVHPGLSLPPEGSVLVLSIPEARQLLTARPVVPFVLVLWFRHGEHADPDVLEPPAIGD